MADAGTHGVDGAAKPTDGGVTPDAAAPPAGFLVEPTGVTADLHAIWGSGPGDVYVVGTQGMILHRSGTWSHTQVTLAYDLTTVWGSGPGEVYVGSIVGGRGASAPIFRSQDGGGTWPAVVGTGYNWVSSLWGSSAVDVWIGLEAAGPTATLVRSSDHLQTEQPTNLPIPSSSHIVAMGGDGSHFLALRADGQLGRSTDRSTWTLTPVPVGTVTGMSVLGNQVFVVAQGGAVARSNDGGASFTVVTSGIAGATAIWATSPTDLYVCGAAGALAHSTDAGVTWHRVTVPTSVDLAALWSSSPTDVYAIGTAGTILHGHD